MHYTMYNIDINVHFLAIPIVLATNIGNTGPILFYFACTKMAQIHWVNRAPFSKGPERLVRTLVMV